MFNTCFVLLLLICFFGSTGVWIQGFILARQAHYMCFCEEKVIVYVVERVLWTHIHR
jgi:uncharacterized membrane protein